MSKKRQPCTKIKYHSYSEARRALDRQMGAGLPVSRVYRCGRHVKATWHTTKREPYRIRRRR